MFSIGTLDSIFAYNLLTIHNPNNDLVYGTIISLEVWATAWIIAGLAAWVSIFMKQDRLGFSLSAMILTCWGILAAIAWMRGILPNGWLSATFFLVLDGLILIPASWPEPRRLVLALVDDSFPDAVITADEQGIITGWHGSSERLFGWSADEAIGNPVNVVIPPRYRQSHDAGLARVRETGRSELAGKILKAEGLHKDGTVFPVHVLVGVYKSDHGITFSATVSDQRETA